MPKKEEVLPPQTSDGWLGRWDARAQNATRAYNFFLRPNKPLDASTSWFNPVARGHFSGFQSGEFVDDLKSLFFKPIIFIGLRLFEPLNTLYYFLSLLWYVLSLSPTKAFYALINTVESVIATPLLELYACLEVFFQLGSFGMRCMFSVFGVLGLGSTSLGATVDEADDVYESAFALG